MAKEDEERPKGTKMGKERRIRKMTKTARCTPTRMLMSSFTLGSSDSGNTYSMNGIFIKIIIILSNIINS